MSFYPGEYNERTSSIAFFASSEDERRSKCNVVELNLEPMTCLKSLEPRAYTGNTFLPHPSLRTTAGKLASIHIRKSPVRTLIAPTHDIR